MQLQLYILLEYILLNSLISFHSHADNGTTYQIKFMY